MHLYKASENEWNKFIVLNNVEYEYLYRLIRCYMHILPEALKNALHSPSNMHLVSTVFFMYDLRMLKLAHASLDQKNEQFMVDMEEILNEVTMKEYAGDIRDYNEI